MTNALEDRLVGALRELGAQASRRTADRAALPRQSARIVPLVAAAAAAVTVLGVTGITALTPFGQDANRSASSGPSGTPARTSPTPSRAQVSEAAERASAFWQEPGYGNVTVDYTGGTVTIRWKGTPPKGVTAMAGQQNTGVVVTLLPARWSQSEVQAAGDRLFSSTLAQLDGATVFATHPLEDMSGLAVEVVQPWSGSTSTLEDVAGMPVEVELVDDLREPLGN